MVTCRGQTFGDKTEVLNFCRPKFLRAHRLLSCIGLATLAQIVPSQLRESGAVVLEGTGRDKRSVNTIKEKCDVAGISKLDGQRWSRIGSGAYRVLLDIRSGRKNELYARD